MGLVDILWGLDLLAGRAEAVGAEFLLSGPVNLWLRGLRGPPGEARFVLLTSRAYGDLLERALSVGSSRLDAPGDLPGVVDGVRFHGQVRGYTVTLLVDPAVRGLDGRIVRVDVSAEARRAAHAIVGGRVVRLAPLGVEMLLWGDV